MTQLVRVLNDLNNLQRTDADTWLPKGEIKADAFSEFRTHAGKLSMYKLGAEIPLFRILAAYALGRDNPVGRPVDYIVLDRDLLTGIGATYVGSSGSTPDQLVNGVHEDVHIGTGPRLMDLVKEVWESKAIDRYSMDDLRSEIEAGFRSGFWQPQEIKNPKTKAALKKFIPELPF